MRLRRLLFIAIGVLSAAVVIAGAGVAALLLYQIGRPGEQLLVIGDSSLSLLDQAGKSRLLADDSSGGLSYPTLSPDGARLAYFGADGGDAVIYVLRLRDGARSEIFRSGDSRPFYMTWSPDGRHISFLSSQSDGRLGVRIVAADGSSAASLVSTASSSSYFSWKPDGSTLLLHIDGTSFQDGRVAAFQPGSDQPLLQLSDPGIFNTPAWSVDGSQIFYVAQPPVRGAPGPDAVESVLTRVAADGTPQALASEKRAAMLFARAPASDDIAYVTVNSAGFGPLKLVDAAGGPARVISREDEQIPAFFWSPDGQQIAYLTFEPLGNGTARLTWHLAGRDGAPIRDLSSFVPSQAFVALLSYFDAYTSSVRLWSPDGGRLVYGAEDGVYVLDVASGKAERRADGAMATWVASK